MDINIFFKSIIDQDKEQIVICDLDYKVIYMNPTACKLYGDKLLGSSLKNCHNERSNMMIEKVINWFKQSSDNNTIHTYYNPKENEDVYMVALRNDTGDLIGFYEKHEHRDLERDKTYSFI